MNLEELEARLRLEVGQLPYPDWVFRVTPTTVVQNGRRAAASLRYVTCTAQRHAGVIIRHSPFHNTWSIGKRPGVVYNTLLEAVTAIELGLVVLHKEPHHANNGNQNDQVL